MKMTSQKFILIVYVAATTSAWWATAVFEREFAIPAAALTMGGLIAVIAGALEEQQ